MHRFVILLACEKVRPRRSAQILREGPPFDIAETSLERHEVFISEGEVVFLFEGTHAEEEARRLMVGRSVIARVGRLGVHIDGEPCLPGEVFSWERPAATRRRDVRTPARAGELRRRSRSLNGSLLLGSAAAVEEPLASSCRCVRAYSDGASRKACGLSSR